MNKYFIGIIMNFFKKGISYFALIDNKSQVSNRVKINNCTKVYKSKINDYSYIGPKTELICTEIGKFCSIAQNCIIGLGMHSIKNISTSPIFTSRKNGTGYSWTKSNTFQEIIKTTIQNDVWIGINVIVMSGITIGNGAIIGAGSIVTKDIPDYAIAVGVPAKVIRYRFSKEIIDKLLEIKWWDLPEDRLKNNINLFQDEEITFDKLEKLKL